VFSSTTGSCRLMVVMSDSTSVLFAAVSGKQPLK
jgi:hypothetical protein